MKGILTLILFVFTLFLTVSCKEDFNTPSIEAIDGEYMSLRTYQTDEQDKVKLTRNCRLGVQKGWSRKCVYFLNRDNVINIKRFNKLPKDERIVAAMNEIRKHPHTVAIVVFGGGSKKVFYEWYKGKDKK